MNKLTVIAFVSLLALGSCQNDPKTSDNHESTPAVSTDKTDKKKVSPAVLNRDPNRRAWSILTADLWHYNFALSVTETPKENIYEGYWLDFEDDFSYVKGYYDKVVAKGEYDYNNDTKILEMIPTEGDDEPSQWSIKTNGEVIILIGTSKYGNNATQIKLTRERERPVNR